MYKEQCHLCQPSWIILSESPVIQTESPVSPVQITKSTRYEETHFQVHFLPSFWQIFDDYLEEI